MEELNRWAENDPLVRRYSIEFNGSQPLPYRVRVWTSGEWDTAVEGAGGSLNFASVRAIIAWAEASA